MLGMAHDPSSLKSKLPPFPRFPGSSLSSLRMQAASSSSNTPSSSTSYDCDTLPAPRLASERPSPLLLDHTPLPRIDSPAPAIVSEDDGESITTTERRAGKGKEVPKSPLPEPTKARKLCVRHQRMADEGMNLKLQESLDALPVEERQLVNSIWSNFSSSSHPRRALILQGLLTMCCFSQLSLLTEQLAHLIRIDPFTRLPREVCLKILGYLDATSLCRAAQVTRQWKALADDDVLWRGICEQHIGQKCRKCGWGLPILEKKRNFRPRSTSPPASEPLVVETSSMSTASLKRRIADVHDLPSPSPPMKRQRSSPETSISTRPIPSTSTSTSASTSNPISPTEPPSSCSLMDSSDSHDAVTRRPWKDVYSERMTIERNWRRGRCTVKVLSGHTDGVMCLQFNENLTCPAFPVLITGSYDRTVRVWNMDTGEELRCLKGHTRAVRALQFDECKLITGSMDHTLKVWDWRRGVCIRTLRGHTDGVVCLNFDSNVLASGGVDNTIKVWNLRTGSAFTLRGHSDWVNAVLLWDSNPGARTSSTSSGLFDLSSTQGCSSSSQLGSEIDAGKMLFSASDDGTIRLWDLTLRTCLRVMTGHMGQVQSMKLLPASDCSDEGAREVEEDDRRAELAALSVADSPTPSSTPSSSSSALPLSTSSPPSSFSTSLLGRKPLLISGSLDNTIKLWDVESGKAVRTLFGHIEGVWGVASDKLRLVSGSHDRTIKVWSREEGKCTATLVGHQAAVSCLALGEDKIISGSDDATIRIWSFAG